MYKCNRTYHSPQKVYRKNIKYEQLILLRICKYFYKFLLQFQDGRTDKRKFQITNNDFDNCGSLCIDAHGRYTTRFIINVGIVVN